MTTHVIVWINRQPVLVSRPVEQAGRDVSVEEVNAALRRIGLDELSHLDEVNGVSPVQMLAIGNALTANFPEAPRGRDDPGPAAPGR